MANIARFLMGMSISLKFLTEFANIPHAKCAPGRGRSFATSASSMWTNEEATMQALSRAVGSWAPHVIRSRREIFCAFTVLLALFFYSSESSAQSPPNCKLQPGGGPMRCADPDDPLARPHEAPAENRGSIFEEMPIDIGRDFASLRNVADAAAVKQGTDFKLFAANLLIYITDEQHVTPRSIELPRADEHGKVPFGEAHFAYARAAPTGDWESLNIDLTGLDNPPASMSIAPIFRRPQADILPRTLPPDLPDPEPLLRRLQDSFPKTGVREFTYNFVEFDRGREKTSLGFDDATLAEVWLSRQGNAWENYLERGPEEDQYAFFAATAPRDRWVWWTMVKHGRVIRRGAPSSNDPLDAWWEFVFADAASAAKTVKCTASRQNPPAQRLIGVPCK
jgi:hypothetical protein